MNKKVVIISILTVLSLAILTMFSFGPLSNIRKQSKINPASLNPVQLSSQVNKSPQSQSNSDNNLLVGLNIYHNVDVKENYYHVSIPKSWQVKSGKNPGDYLLDFPDGNGWIGLMDVPDNTTLELFLLSQAEPKLKKTISNYQRSDYQKISINGKDGYELIYSSEVNQEKLNTIIAYITGQDQAGVISFSTPLNNFSNLQPVFDKVIKSFSWQNK